MSQSPITIPNHNPQSQSPITIPNHNPQSQSPITIPNHNPIRIGTLAAIVSDVAAARNQDKAEIITILFR
jgi:hypothetical protein